MSYYKPPYLRFYFRFPESRQYQFSLKIRQQALFEITRHMIDFIGMYTWEELCREWTLRAGAMGILPFLSDQVGSAWDRSVEVDVVGINRRPVSGTTWTCTGMRLIALDDVDHNLADWSDYVDRFQSGLVKRVIDCQAVAVP